MTGVQTCALPIFISEDRTIFALRTDGDWLYFGHHRKGNGGQIVKRALWEGIGLGWEAIARFEALELPNLQVSDGNPLKKTVWSDDRSLNY